MPAGFVAITGGTGVGASDDLAAGRAVPQAEDLYTHLDAAWAGEICEVVRAMDGFEIVTKPTLSLFSFRCSSGDATRQRLVDAINDAMHVARAWDRKSVSIFVSAQRSAGRSLRR